MSSTGDFATVPRVGNARRPRTYRRRSGQCSDRTFVDDGAYEQLAGPDLRGSEANAPSDGHLIFSYANRTPSAWAALFTALQQAGLRACGCEIVHSENETDHAKRGVRSCTLDLILDLTPAGSAPLRPHPPNVHASGEEADFLRTVADTFLMVGWLDGDWRTQFFAKLRNSLFLMARIADGETGNTLVKHIRPIRAPI